MADEKRTTGITLIAIFKLLKATALVGIAVGAFGVAGRGGPQVLGHWSHLLGIDPHNHYVDRAIGAVSGQSPHKLHEIGVGTFVYAALFLVEGTGLWFKRHWAEWLTVGITTSFIPIEVWEIGKEPTAARIIALVLNLAAVIYLLVHLRNQRMQRHSPERADADEPATLRRHGRPAVVHRSPR
jgi:uncharacterized membrane protein (DUF2068 family)